MFRRVAMLFIPAAHDLGVSGDAIHFAKSGQRR